MPSLAGTKLDKYEVLEEVGHGGMAVVYRGIDSVLKREVAIKVLHPHLADRAESRARLEREAIAVAKLRHENILEIFDYSAASTGTRESYIVTEFIHGPTLRDWLDQDYLARPAVAALVVHRLALALVHAHKSSIVHRDIKPENVMIRREDGCIKLMDFGIAQILDNQKLTMTGQLIGSPAYMAPELINGRPLDARTDLFSLGILLYQLATGELPFAGRNPHEVLNRIADGNYPPPSTVNPLVDGDLEAILAKALATNPDERFQSADAMARELERYLAEMDLEPTAAELRAYFQGATSAIADLDARVSTALMARAQQAAQEGLHARALRLLGRVLEHDKDNREARGMLVRLRVRARRMRQVMIAAAALGLVGLVVAGAVLLPGAPWSEPIAIADAQPALDPAERGASLGSMPLQPPEPRAVDPSAGDRSSGGDDEPATVPEPGLSAVDGTTGDPTRVRPGVKASAGRPPPLRTPTKSVCSLVLQGIALPTARNLSLKIRPSEPGSTASSLPIDALTMPVSFPGAEANVSIDDGPWRAHRRVTWAECHRGAVTMQVSPKPAKITFEGAPNGLAVTCESGCPDGLLGPDGTAMADKFPPIPFDVDTDTRKVTLLLKSEDFQPKKIVQTLRPGPNRVSCDLEPRVPG